jgi:putative transposase
MTTLDAVTRKKKPAEASAEELAAQELVRMAKGQGLSLAGPNGLLKQFTKTVLETALNEEMTEHLGFDKGQAPTERESNDVRNGSRAKTVLTEATGQVRTTPDLLSRLVVFTYTTPDDTTKPQDTPHKNPKSRL